MGASNRHAEPNIFGATRGVGAMPGLTDRVMQGRSLVGTPNVLGLAPDQMQRPANITDLIGQVGQNLQAAGQPPSIFSAQPGQPAPGWTPQSVVIPRITDLVSNVAGAQQHVNNAMGRPAAPENSGPADIASIVRGVGSAMIPGQQWAMGQVPAGDARAIVQPGIQAAQQGGAGAPNIADIIRQIRLMQGLR